MIPAGPENNYHYNKELRPYANRLRKRMTKAEACMWKYVLKARKMKGYSFRRQRPILNYVADFACLKLLLVIEIDGSYHLREDVQKKDKLREIALENIGFTVLRFTNLEVLHHIHEVKRDIEEWIELQEKPV